MPIKHRLLYLRHNLRAHLAPGPDKVPLGVGRLGDIWAVTDKDAGRVMFVPSFERWHRFRHGVVAQCENVARQYRVAGPSDVRPGDRVIDIGANVGEFTIYAESKGAEVLAIEADRNVGSLLLKNIEGCDRVEVELVPVWKEDDVLVFHSSPESADSSLIRPDERIRSSTRRRAFSLDTLVERWFPDGVVHLIKCDAEGAEPEVVQGAAKTLERTRWVAIDCGPERQGERTDGEVMKQLVAGGFQIVEKPTAARTVVLARNKRFESTRA